VSPSLKTCIEKISPEDGPMIATSVPANSNGAGSEVRPCKIRALQGDAVIAARDRGHRFSARPGAAAPAKSILPGRAKAIAAMHGSPAHPWSLDELASRGGMSRSSFAEVFSPHQPDRDDGKDEAHEDHRNKDMHLDARHRPRADFRIRKSAQ
jgi:hypothetical protein